MEMSHIFNLPMPQPCRKKSLIMYDQNGSFSDVPLYQNLLKQINQTHHLKP